MRGSFRLHLILLLAAAFAGLARADTDPSLSQVYEAVRAGHLEQARQMMGQVLKDHPKSAKAHYVAAEVSSASGDFAQGRKELRVAEELAPGLPFAAPESVRELRDRLSRTSVAHTPPASAQTAGRFPLGVLALAVVAIGIVLALLLTRRRELADRYAESREGVPLQGAAPPPGSAAAGPGAGPSLSAAGAPPSAGTGIASSIAGSLAGGLAAGAGIVAGEEIARHLLNSGEHDVNGHEASSPPGPEAKQDEDPRNDLGGNEFGVSGSGSWDDDDQAPRDDDWN